MNSDAILITAIIFIFLYLTTLLTLVWLLNRSYGQTEDWNRARDDLVVQADADQTQAQQVIAEIKQKYGGLGAPYPADRDQALGTLDHVFNTAQRILDDRRTRVPIDSVRVVQPSKALLLLPLWGEYRQRRNWWQATENLQAALAENGSKFQGVDQLLSELKAKGEGTRTAYLDLQNKTTKLIKDFEGEARTQTQFQDQINKLQNLKHRLTQVLAENLSGKEISPQQVAVVYPKLHAYNQLWEQLAEDIESHRRVRRETRSQLKVNREIITRVRKLLSIEAEARRPTPTFQDQIERESVLLDEQEQLRRNGVYRKEPAMEQEVRIQSLESRLKELRDQRLVLENVHRISGEQIPQTESWMDILPAPFVIDQTDELLENIRSQRTFIFNLLHATDDLDQLTRYSFIDPEQLVVARSKFDGKRGTYTSKHQDLQQQIPQLIVRTTNAIKNLRSHNSHYLTQVNLKRMAADVKTLADRWSVSGNPPQILESQFDQFISELDQIEGMVTTISACCTQAEELQKRINADREKARDRLEDPRFVELHQDMVRISLESGFSSAAQAMEYTDRANQLIQDFDQIDSNFSSIAADAKNLLTQMDYLRNGYERQYNSEKEKVQTLAGQLTNLKSDLQKYQNHEISAFRVRTNEQLARMDPWLDLSLPTTLQSLLEHFSKGQELRVQVQDLLSNEIGPDVQKYNTAKKGAGDAISGAKAAIEAAEKEIKTVPWESKSSSWGVQSSPSNHPALVHCHRYLDAAEARFREITDPEIEYQSSVEKAIHDLTERVGQNAARAKEEAEKIQRETREQSDEIQGGSRELRKMLSDGDQLARQLTDHWMQDQWGQIHGDYRDLDKDLEGLETYQDAYRFLDRALMRVGFQIEKMRQSENSET